MYRRAIHVMASCVVLSARRRVARGHLTCLMALGWVFLSAVGSAAGTLAYTGVGTSTTGGSNDLTIGFSFTPTSDISVDSLGVADFGDDGLDEAHPIGIWRESDTTLLASVTVPAGLAAPFDSGFRFSSIASTALLSGVGYRIGVFREAGSLDVYSFNGVIATAPEVTRGVDAFIFPGAGLTYPSTTDGSARSVVNFTFHVVPEPSSIVIALVGVFVLGGHGLGRRRR